MGKGERIANIARIESRKEREAARSVAEARARLDEIEGRLNELRRYRDEYLDRLQAGVNDTITVAQLKHYQLFLRRLDQGVAHAEGSVARARDHWERAQSQWRTQRSRLDALGKVADHYEREDARAQNRRDQRALDDRVAAAPRRRSMDRETG